MPTVVLAGSASAATTLVVNNGSGGDTAGACATPGYTTIQDAVAVAVSGDIIQVCSGSYAGQVDDGAPVKDLTFRGAQYGQDARTRDTSSAATTETTVVASMGMSAFVLQGHSTIDGFTISGYTPSPFTGGAIDANGSSDDVINTIFSGNSVAAVINADGVHFGRDKVVGSGTGQAAGFYFGLFSNSAGDRSTVETTDFSAVILGVFIGNEHGRVVDFMTLRNNYADTSGGGTFAALGGSTAADVNNNVVTGDGRSGVGIDLSGNNSGFSLTANRITGLTAANAIGFDRPSTTSTDNGSGTINRNVLKSNLRGIDDGSDAGTIEAHSNIFVGNSSVAFRNTTDTSTFNGQDNFFGCNGGPGAGGCDVVAGAGAMRSAPYLVLSSTIGSHSVPVGQHTTFTAGLTTDNSGATVALPVLAGEPIAFSFTKGTVNPPSSALGAAGTASTAVTVTATGPGTVTGRVDNATTSQVVNTTPPGPPQLTIHDAQTVEGNVGFHPLVFSVTLSRKSSSPVTVRYTTANGSARSPGDFTAKSGTLTIPAGHTGATVAVQIKGDTIREPNETLAVDLFSPTHATVADPVGQGVIRNDD